MKLLGLLIAAVAARRLYERARRSNWPGPRIVAAMDRYTRAFDALGDAVLDAEWRSRALDWSGGAPEVVLERQAARDVTLTWQPGPGAPLGAQRVVPGDPSTYPAEGEPMPPHDTEGA